MDKIYFNSKSSEYKWLSNFFPTSFRDLNGQLFLSSEQYYVYCKAANKEDAEKVLNANYGGMVKKIGQQIKIRDDWEEIKIEAMRHALWFKFSQNEDLKQKLLDTGDVELIEYAPWGDTFWGVDKNKEGNNVLGKMLMGLRAYLKNKGD